MGAEAWWDEEGLLKEYEVPSAGEQSIFKLLFSMLHNIANLLNASEVYTFKWLIFLNVYVHIFYSKIYRTLNLPFLPFLSEQFRSSKYTDTVVQPSAPSTHRTFHFPKLKLCPH